MKTEQLEVKTTLQTSEEAKRELNALEIRLQEKFTLLSLTISEYSINSENEFYTARYCRYNTPKMTINSKCDMDAKDITTFEEFEAAKAKVTQAREDIKRDTLWIAESIYENVLDTDDTHPDDLEEKEDA